MEALLMMPEGPRSTTFPRLDALLGGGMQPGHGVLVLDRTPCLRAVPLLVGLGAALAAANAIVLYVHDAGAVLDRRAELLALRGQGVHLVDGTPPEVLDFAEKVGAHAILVEALYALGPADDHERAARAHRALFRGAAALPGAPATWLLATRPPRDTIQQADTGLAVTAGATPDDLALEALWNRRGPRARTEFVLLHRDTHWRLREVDAPPPG